MARRLIVPSVLIAAALIAGETAGARGAAHERTTASVRVGCPTALERVGYDYLRLSDAVSAAQHVLYREVASNQGRHERRAAINTPVVAVVMELGSLEPPRIQGQRGLLNRAARICGRLVARASAVVLFQDGLSIICCGPPITLFVVRTDRGVHVYRSLSG